MNLVVRSTSETSLILSSSGSSMRRFCRPITLPWHSLVRVHHLRRLWTINWRAASHLNVSINVRGWQTPIRVLTLAATVRSSLLRVKWRSQIVISVRKHTTARLGRDYWVSQYNVISPQSPLRFPPQSQCCHVKANAAGATTLNHAQTLRATVRSFN